MEFTFDLKVEDFAKNFHVFEEGTLKSLGHLGGYCRKVMYHSIKTAPEGTFSAPNEPPYSKLGWLKDYIYYAVDRNSMSVVIGPAKINRPGEAPAVLEYGGESLIVVGSGANQHLESVYIMARPYANPALLETKRRCPELLKDSMTGLSFETF